VHLIAGGFLNLYGDVLPRNDAYLYGDAITAVRSTPTSRPSTQQSIGCTGARRSTLVTGVA